MRTLVHLIGYSTVALASLVIGAAIMAGGDAGAEAAAPETITSTATVTDPGVTTTTTAPPVTTTRTTTKTVTAESPPPATDIPGDGTFEVGVDVEPGTYVSEAPTGRACYWARLSNATGHNIIDKNIATGQSIVTIAASDAFFETSGCSGWTKR